MGVVGIIGLATRVMKLGLNIGACKKNIWIEKQTRYQKAHKQSSPTYAYPITCRLLDKSAVVKDCRIPERGTCDECWKPATLKTCAGAAQTERGV